MGRQPLLSLLTVALLAACGAQREPVQHDNPEDHPVVTTPEQSGESASFPARDYTVKVPFDAVPADAPTRGQWSRVVPWAALSIHTALLPDGQVMTFGGNTYPDWERYQKQTPIQYPNKIDLWNPATGKHEDISFVGSSVFCAGHVLLPDGRLLVAGGDDISNLFDAFSRGAGIKDAHIYDYASKTWVKAASMSESRWYPTTTVLPDGDVLTVAGSTINGETHSRVPEVYDPETDTWRKLTGAVRPVEWYPWLFVLSDGRVINVGSGKYSTKADETTTGIYETQGHGKLLPFDRGDGMYRDYGTAVMYGRNKMLVVGGGGDWNDYFNPQRHPPTATARVIEYDPRTRRAASRGTTPMSKGRRHAVATLMPDGTVLVTGGVSGFGFNRYATAVLEPELWDPQTERWAPLAPMSVPRVYHSTALLLPDATVLVSGGGACRGDDMNDPDCPTTAYDPDPGKRMDGYNKWKNTQVFRPPYLFDASGRLAERPSIERVASIAGYNAQLDIETRDAANIRKVTLVRLGSVTHAFNMNQRINELEVLGVTDGSVRVRTPGGAKLAPPGHYMLFILDAQGVPSVARIIQLGG